MDALYLRYVFLINKHENYLARLNSVARFRRNQILIERERIEIVIGELQKIMEWIHSYGILVNVNARKWRRACHRLINVLTKKYNKFVERIEMFDEDDVASDSYDEDFSNLTSSSE